MPHKQEVFRIITYVEAMLRRKTTTITTTTTNKPLLMNKPRKTSEKQIKWK